MSAQRKKPDLSRLVMLNLTPSEAANLAGVLAYIGKKVRVDKGPADLLALLEGVTARINLQLDQLHLPAERRRAPYPV
jgi:hypothetical protein